MKLLTIIVTYNGMQWIDRCIQSVIESTIKSDIYIIDNGSTDGTQDYIKKNFPKVILLQSASNLGFGKANNIGMKFAIDKNYEYIYLLNQDAWVMNDTFEKLIALHQIHSDYGILSPMQLKPDSMHFEIFFDEFVRNSISSELIQDLYFNRFREIYQVSFIQAAHWLISRECFLKVGLFSPIFPHYCEDDNYCERIQYHGFRIGIVTKAKAVHDAGSKPPMTKTKRNYRLFVGNIERLSNIYNPTPHLFWRLMIDSLNDCKKYRSLAPLGMLIKSFMKYRIIKKYRDCTKMEGAFINE